MKRLFKYISMLALLFLWTTPVNAYQDDFVIITGTTNPPVHNKDVYPGELYWATNDQILYYAHDSGVSDISSGSGGAPDAHKDSHDPEDGADALDTAQPVELASVQSGSTGTAHTFARSDHVHQIQHSIADNHLVTIDSADVADDEYARFTASGLESRTTGEVLTDINVEDGADVTDATNVDAAGAVMESDYNAQTILQATNDNTPVVLDVHEQELVGRLTGGNISGVTIGISNDYIVQIDSADVATGEYAKFTANGIESKTTGEVQADLDLEIGTDVQAWDATLDDIADGTITENLVNTTNPWADNEVADDITITNASQIQDLNVGTDITADLEEETHASEHAVGAADTVFPADPNADRYLMWDDDPGQLAWAAGVGGGGDFSDGGDIAGKSRSLGNLDAEPLGFLISGTTEFGIDEGGRAWFYDDVFLYQENDIYFYQTNKRLMNHSSLANGEYFGDIIYVDIDSNPNGFAYPMVQRSDGEYVEADASSGTSMPCTAISLSPQTIFFLQNGWICDTGWSWTPGDEIFVAVGGGVTNVAPINAIRQKIGTAITSNIIDFKPINVTNVDIWIVEDTTIYCDPTGADDSGTGTASNPFFSPHRAMEYLADYLIAATATVTIQMNDGTYDLSSLGSCDIYHLNGQNIAITGETASSGTTLEFDGNSGFTLEQGKFGNIDKLTITGTHGTGNGILANKFSYIQLGTDVVIQDFDAGVYAINFSSIYCRSVEISNCDRGIQAYYNSFVDADDSVIYDCDEQALRAIRFSSLKGEDCDIDNIDDRAVYCTDNSYICIKRTDIDHDGVGGDGTYGCYANMNAFIDAQDVVMDTSGHITADYSPSATTDNDPTFGNAGSWIYGP
jgi:hypothetical protein